MLSAICPKLVYCIKNDIVYPYTQGFFSGDGSYKYKNNVNSAVIDLYGEKQELLQYLDFIRGPFIYNDAKRIVLPLNLNEKYYVPINATLQNKLEWFQGYLDADGYLFKSNLDKQSIRISSTNKQFLFNVKF